MGDMCGDNRFEIIKNAKEAVLVNTNIDSSPKEMEVLDSFLFRCWQMGWLEKYDVSKPKTNADRIRAMNDFELRQFICANNRCETCRWSAAYGCKLMEWLKEPAEEDE